MVAVGFFCNKHELSPKLQYIPRAGAVHTQGCFYLVALAIKTLWDTMKGGSQERFAEPVRRTVIPVDYTFSL